MVRIAAFLSDQYPATDEVQCLTVYIPAGDEFKALAAGLLALACRPENYDDPESAQADGLAAIWDTAYSLIEWTGCNVNGIGYQDRIYLPGFGATAYTGTSFTQTFYTNVGVVYYQSTPLITNVGGFPLLRLRAGSWQAWWSTMLSNAAGKVDVWLDHATDDISLVTNLDLYNVVPIVSLFGPWNFVVPEDGEYILKFSVVGKNALSSSYYYFLCGFSLVWQSPPA